MNIVRCPLATQRMAQIRIVCKV